MLRITACVPHLHTGCAPIRNLPWRRPAGPSWPLEADRKVAPHGQLLARRKYGYGLKAKTSIIQLSICLSIYLSICLSICLSSYLSIYLICLSNYVSIYLPIYLSIYLSLCLSVCLSICLSASLKTKLFCETSLAFELDNIKTQQFCETSSMFELDNVKNEAIPRDFLNF